MFLGFFQKFFRKLNYKKFRKTIRQTFCQEKFVSFSNYPLRIISESTLKFFLVFYALIELLCRPFTLILSRFTANSTKQQAIYFKNVSKLYYFLNC